MPYGLRRHAPHDLLRRRGLPSLRGCWRRRVPFGFRSRPPCTLLHRRGLPGPCGCRWRRWILKFVWRAPLALLRDISAFPGQTGISKRRRVKRIGRRVANLTQSPWRETPAVSRGGDSISDDPEVATCKTQQVRNTKPGQTRGKGPTDYLLRGTSPRLSPRVCSSPGVNAPADDMSLRPGTPVENKVLTSSFHPWQNEGGSNHRAGPGIRGNGDPKGGQMRNHLQHQSVDGSG